MGAQLSNGDGSGVDPDMSWEADAADGELDTNDALRLTDIEQDATVEPFMASGSGHKREDDEGANRSSTG